MLVSAPRRIAIESIRYFIARGYIKRRTEEALDYIAQLLPMAVGSVDRLEEIPDRLHFVFDFDPLWQPDTADRGDGLGLGLALVKRLVEAHNGHVDVESTSGRGTTVRLMLPVAQTGSGTVAV